VSTDPLKSVIFGKWYDDMRPLLRRRAGLKLQLPEPVDTEVRLGLPAPLIEAGGGMPADCTAGLAPRLDRYYAGVPG